MKHELMAIGVVGLVACGGSESSEDAAPQTGDTAVIEMPPADTSPPEDTGSPPAIGGETPVALPVATEACPAFVPGDIEVLGRTVHLWMDEDVTAESSGPLVFYWSAAGIPDPTLEVQAHFTEVVDEVVAAGGVVAAVYRQACEDCVSSSGLPWWYVEDLDVADEIVACAIEQVGIDTARIHVAGTSAGGIHGAQMLYRRSNYVASVATYSGGVADDEPAANTMMEDPSNLVPAIIMYGEMDFLSGLSFGLQADLTDKGHFTVLCEHDRGHGIAAPLAPSVWSFFEAHPYKTTSSWSAGLPVDLYEGCAL